MGVWVVCRSKPPPSARTIVPGTAAALTTSPALALHLGGVSRKLICSVGHQLRRPGLSDGKELLTRKALSIQETQGC